MRREFSVGLFFMIMTLALGYMLSRLIKDGGVFTPTKSYYTVVADSIGLLEGSSVRVAGIIVGSLHEKRLEKKKARLVIEISSNISVREDAFITIRSIGYLGDRFMELAPGSDDKPPLPEDSLIPSEEGVTVDRVMSTGVDMMENWADVGGRLSELLGGGG